MFLEIPQTVPESSHLWRRCFPVNFVKFLKTPFLQNTSGRLASVHMHVERAIQTVKKFRVLRNKIPLSFYGYVKQMYVKPQIFLFFSEALSMWNQITNKNTDNSATINLSHTFKVGRCIFFLQRNTLNFLFRKSSDFTQTVWSLWLLSQKSGLNFSIKELWVLENHVLVNMLLCSSHFTEVH